MNSYCSLCNNKKKIDKKIICNECNISTICSNCFHFKFYKCCKKNHIICSDCFINQKKKKKFKNCICNELLCNYCVKFVQYFKCSKCLIWYICDKCHFNSNEICFFCFIKIV